MTCHINEEEPGNGWGKCGTLTAWRKSYDDVKDVDSLTGKMKDKKI